MSINLPNGFWIKFDNLALNCTVEALQQLFLDRTGVFIPAERIQLSQPYPPQRTCCSALISIDKRLVTEILKWAFSEDTVFGNKLRIVSQNLK